jgi:hypothetical protein
MGFSVYYRSTRPVSPKEAAAIREAADRETAGRSWLSCEPAHFFANEPGDEGRLFGASKPNFTPHPDDAASAARSGLPDGDVPALLEILAGLSRDHGVDWEIGHDAEPEPVGFIRGGTLDPRLEGLAETLADVTRAIAAFEAGEDPEEGDDGDDGPRILPL